MQNGASHLTVLVTTLILLALAHPGTAFGTDTSVCSASSCYSCKQAKGCYWCNTSGRGPPVPGSTGESGRCVASGTPADCIFTPSSSCVKPTGSGKGSPSSDKITCGGDAMVQCPRGMTCQTGFPPSMPTRPGVCVTARSPPPPRCGKYVRTPCPAGYRCSSTGALGVCIRQHITNVTHGGRRGDVMRPINRTNHAIAPSSPNPSYTQRKHQACASIMIGHVYSSSALSARACSKMRGCAGVYDKNCDSIGLFQLCSSNASPSTGSGSHSKLPSGATCYTQRNRGEAPPEVILDRSKDCAPGLTCMTYQGVAPSQYGLQSRSCHSRHEPMPPMAPPRPMPPMAPPARGRRTQGSANRSFVYSSSSCVYVPTSSAASMPVGA